MHTLKPLFAGVVMALCGSLHAEKLTYLTLYFNEGATAYVNVTGATPGAEGKAYMKIGPESLIVTVPKSDTQEETYTYEATDLNYFTFERHDFPLSSLSGLTASGQARITALGGGRILVSGEGATETGVYDLNGRRLSVSVSEGDGTLTFSLADLPAGVYIIACPTAQLKITKK